MWNLPRMLGNCHTPTCVPLRALVYICKCLTTVCVLMHLKEKYGLGTRLQRHRSGAPITSLYGLSWVSTLVSFNTAYSQTCTILQSLWPVVSIHAGLFQHRAVTNMWYSCLCFSHLPVSNGKSSFFMFFSSLQINLYDALVSAALVGTRFLYFFYIYIPTSHMMYMWCFSELFDAHLFPFQCCKYVLICCLLQP